MLLIVGLGNPGKKYDKTWHNVGSLAIGELESFDLPDVTLTRPGTFMNESGQAVKKLVKNSKLKTGGLIVLHDDIDIPLGEIKIAKNRGAAGHKGVESIIKALGTKDFVRIRIGICPSAGKPKNAEDFVLKNFGREEKEADEAIKKAAKAAGTIVTDGLEKAMNEYNK
jgi:PTH1 family peptidyl-tRNA hydrolase